MFKRYEKLCNQVDNGALILSIVVTLFVSVGVGDTVSGVITSMAGVLKSYVEVCAKLHMHGDPLLRNTHTTPKKLPKSPKHHARQSYPVLFLPLHRARWSNFSQHHERKERHRLASRAFGRITEDVIDILGMIQVWPPTAQLQTCTHSPSRVCARVCGLRTRAGDGDLLFALAFWVHSSVGCGSVSCNHQGHGHKDDGRKFKHIPDCARR